MSTALPPGQRTIDYFPRFGVPAYASRLPELAAAPELKLEWDAEASSSVRIDDLGRLQRKELRADFHCVTTWTYRDLKWSGYAFKDLYEQLVTPRAPSNSSRPFVELKALDGYSTSILLEDLLSENVLLADRLNDQALSPEHGAPFRLVAPDLYGYKNVKHLSTMRFRRDFCRGLAERQTRAHPRGRVWLEERGRGLPGRLYRPLYRAMLAPTLWYYRQLEKRGGRSG